MTEEPQTEQEWAAYYQAHKDDPDLWSEPVPAPPRRRGRPSRGLEARITVRFTREELALIDRIAAAEGKSYVDVIRHAVHAYAGQTDVDMKSA